MLYHTIPERHQLWSQSPTTEDVILAQASVYILALQGPQGPQGRHGETGPKGPNVSELRGIGVIYCYSLLPHPALNVHFCSRLVH